MLSLKRRMTSLKRNQMVAVLTSLSIIFVASDGAAAELFCRQYARLGSEDILKNPKKYARTAEEIAMAALAGKRYVLPPLEYDLTTTYSVSAKGSNAVLTIKNSPKIEMNGTFKLNKKGAYAVNGTTYTALIGKNKKIVFDDFHDSLINGIKSPTNLAAVQIYLESDEYRNNIDYNGYMMRQQLCANSLDQLPVHIPLDVTYWFEESVNPIIQKIGQSVTASTPLYSYKKETFGSIELDCVYAAGGKTYGIVSGSGYICALRDIDPVHEQNAPLDTNTKTVLSHHDSQKFIQKFGPLNVVLYPHKDSKYDDGTVFISTLDGIVTIRARSKFRDYIQGKMFW